MLIRIEAFYEDKWIELGYTIMCDRCNRLLPDHESTIASMEKWNDMYSPFLLDVCFKKNVVSGETWWKHLCNLCLDKLDAENLWEPPVNDIIEILHIHGIKAFTVDDIS